jgi:hypothetical protein
MQTKAIQHETAVRTSIRHRVLWCSQTDGTAVSEHRAANWGQITVITNVNLYIASCGLLTTSYVVAVKRGYRTLHNSNAIEIIYLQWRLGSQTFSLVLRSRLRRNI